MHENRTHEPSKGDYNLPGIKVGKRPYESPSRFNLAQCHTKGGALTDVELETVSQSGGEG